MTKGDPLAKEQKELIRHEARARRASIPGPTRLKAAEALAAHLPSFLSAYAIRPQSLIGCYLAIGTEINTSPVLRALQRMGHRVCLPRTVMPSAPLQFVEWATNEPLQQDMLGFPTPASDRVVQPDALLIPLVAFDRQGGRIGQGSGLYDRTLNMLRRERPHLPVLGIAFSCQEVTEVPVEPHDQMLDGILTETGFIEVAKELESRAVHL